MDGVCGGLLGRSRSRSRSRKWRVDQHSSTQGGRAGRGRGVTADANNSTSSKAANRARRLCATICIRYTVSTPHLLSASHPILAPREMMTSPLPFRRPRLMGEFTRALDVRNRNPPSKQERGARTGFFPYSHRHFQLRIGIVVPLKQNDSGPQPKR